MGSITIIGTGLNAGQLTLDAVEALQSGARVLLHTGRCACAAWLGERGIAFETLDELYESCEDFDEHALAAAQAVIAAAEGGPVLYGVFDVRDPAHPAETGSLVLEETELNTDYKAFVTLPDGSFLLPYTNYRVSETAYDGDDEVIYYAYSMTPGALHVAVPEFRQELTTEKFMELTDIGSYGEETDTRTSNVFSVSENSYGRIDLDTVSGKATVLAALP